LAYPLGINHALTRTVRDSALLLDISQGPTTGDPYVIAPPVRPYLDEVGAEPGRCRVAVSFAMPSGDTIDPECAAVVERAVALLAEAGHEVQEAAPDYPLEALGSVMGVFMSVPLLVDVDARLAELGRDLRDDDLEPMTRMIYENGKRATGAQVVAAHQELERCAQQIGAFFDGFDLLVTATIARTVPPLGLLDTTNVAAMQQHAGKVAALTMPFNVTGQPAISLPIGVDPLGLPVGVQIVAAYGREDLLVRIASQLEAMGAWDPTPVWPPNEG
jgi:amidase